MGEILIDDVYSGGTSKEAEKTGHTLLSEAMADGFLHPRCQDAFTTYFEGVSTPPEQEQVTADEEQTIKENNRLKQKQQYHKLMAEKCHRIADNSLDEDNQKVYTSRATEHTRIADEIGGVLENNTQFYKSVVINSNKVIHLDKGKNSIKLLQLMNTNNQLFLSQKVKLKPKQLHIIDKCVTEALKALHITNSENLPKFCIISNKEMATGAIAGYNPIKNILYIDENAGNLEKLIEIQSINNSNVCSKSNISSYVHELIHWKDAEEYRQKFGKIDDFSNYINYLNKKFYSKLENLQNNGYNIKGISKYSDKMLIQGRYDEVYTEYRVKDLLKG